MLTTTARHTFHWSFLTDDGITVRRTLRENHFQLDSVAAATVVATAATAVAVAVNEKEIHCSNQSIAVRRFINELFVSFIKQQPHGRRQPLTAENCLILVTTVVVE